MALISQLSLKELVDLNEKSTGQLAGCTALEDAAQEYMSILYDALSESIILARLFATISFAELPGPNKTFVRNLAQSTGISELIKDRTLVLTLLEARGQGLSGTIAVIRRVISAFPWLLRISSTRSP